MIYRLVVSNNFDGVVQMVEEEANQEGGLGGLIQDYILYYARVNDVKTGEASGTISRKDKRPNSVRTFNHPAKHTIELQIIKL